MRLRPQVLPGSVQADGRGVRDGERIGRVPVLSGQRHQPSGAGQHLRRAVEGHQQEQRLGQLGVEPGRRDQEGESRRPDANANQRVRVPVPNQSVCAKVICFLFSLSDG